MPEYTATGNLKFHYTARKSNACTLLEGMTNTGVLDLFLQFWSPQPSRHDWVQLPAQISNASYLTARYGIHLPTKTQINSASMGMWPYQVSMLPLDCLKRIIGNDVWCVNGLYLGYCIYIVCGAGIGIIILMLMNAYILLHYIGIGIGMYGKIRRCTLEWFTYTPASCWCNIAYALNVP